MSFLSERIGDLFEFVITRVLERFSNILSYPFLTSSQDRLYSVYLLSYAVLAIGIYLAQRSETQVGLKSLLRFTIPRDVYLHRSAIVDYKFYVVNRILRKVLFITYLASSFFVIGEYVNEILTSWLGPVPAMACEECVGVLNFVYAISLFLVSDFGFFISHYFHHKWSVFWEFHKVHHSAAVLTPFTSFRFHPLELFVNFAVKSFLVGLVGGAFGYVFSGTLERPEFLTISFLNIGVITFVFLIFANVRHSHLWLSYGYVLNHIFISPAQHQIHHSCEARHIDRNLGLALAVWDWMFGTLYVPRGKETFELGLQNREHEEYNSVIRLYGMPFKKAAQLLFK